MAGSEPRSWTAEQIRDRFDANPPGTIGVEEELLLVEAASWAPAPVADQVVARAATPLVKPELLACQVEIATGVHADPALAMAELQACRATVAAACDDGVVPVAGAVHPRWEGPARLAATARSEALSRDYREVVAHQVVSALQVHVAVGGADRTLAVHDALRSHLPELAALAAASPFHAGRDTGLCSVRPTIATRLPRQGVPPAIGSWERFAEDLAWAQRGTTLRDPGSWWWELRPNLAHGTLEIRVMDVQPDRSRTAAVVALAHALVCQLAARHAEEGALPVVATRRIAENRWAALRDGPAAQVADLRTGDPTPMRDRLIDLIDVVEPHAPAGLDGARRLIDDGAARRLREVGIDGALPWLAEVFLR